jgi:hypothetical protein
MEGLFDADDLLLDGVPELPRRRHGDEDDGMVRRRRDLNGGGGDRTNYLVDKDGNLYEPYSLAWRYLGLYVDCNSENNGGGDGHDDRNHRDRALHDEGGNRNGNGGGSNCVRRLLWAAYVDNEYEGNTIEEYKFYDIHTSSWDNSTCFASGTAHRCTKLNCHEPYTRFEGNRWELIGIYKETAGMYDWFEQLFKHQGVCIWNDDDVYDTMETWMEKFPYQCTKLKVTDDNGNTIYMSTEPLMDGNMTIGIYTDSDCLTLSEDMDYPSYIVKYYMNYYNEQSYYYYYYRNYCESFRSSRVHSRRISKEGLDMLLTRSSSFVSNFGLDIMLLHFSCSFVSPFCISPPIDRLRSP